MEYPFGYRGGIYGREPNPDEQRVIRRAIQIRQEGFSHRAIAYWLNKEGYKNRGGGPIVKNLVAKILARAAPPRSDQAV